jgi:hypothetical protein
VGGLGIDAKANEEAQKKNLKLFVEFLEEEGRTSLGGHTTWDEGKVMRGER